jgi:multidrug transporter EmrE-like cation transporter
MEDIYLLVQKEENKEMEFEFIPILIGVFMAFIDVITFSIIKFVSSNEVKLLSWMILPTILYAAEPWVFLKGLQFERMYVVNLLWNVLSSVLVTLVGIYYFGEKTSMIKNIGILLSIFSIFLLSASED